jgi:hypothetical protein
VSDSDAWRTRTANAGLWNRRLALAVGAVVVQTLLLVGVVAAPERLPDVSRGLVFGLSIVVASALGLDVRAMDAESSWWRPLRPAWALGGAVVGANAGVVLAYGLRRVESHEATSPTERWRRPAVAAALLAGLGTALFQSVSTGTPEVVDAVILVVAGNAFGFALVGLYYDTRYVTARLDGTGHGWFARGYHWIVLGVVVVPANVGFVLLYLWRRRTLLQRAANARAGFGDLGSPGVNDPDEGGD